MEANDFSGYYSLMSPLATQGLKTSPTDTATVNMGMVRAAGLLLIKDDPALYEQLGLVFAWMGANGDEPLVDPAGHRRPVYLPLAFHLALVAWGMRVGQPLPAGAHRVTARLNESLDDPSMNQDISLTLWRLMCLDQYSSMTGDQTLRTKVQQRVKDVISHPGDEGSLHKHDTADSLDAWTYRELLGLHALFNMAVLRSDEALKVRCREVVAYHVNNTQPDNTTNQPWALAAFLSESDGRSFGDQQIHDATAQGRLSPGQGVGLIASLLLADALHVLRVI